MPRFSSAHVRLGTVAMVAIGLCSVTMAVAQGSPPKGPADGKWPVEAGELRLQQAVAEGLVPGAAILLTGPRSVRLERFFGRYHQDTRIPISGASQWMAAATILGEVEAGAFDLDDPLIRFFPNIDDKKGAVSVRQLLAHTSGLAGSHSCLGDRSTTLAACAAAILETTLLADPGEEIRYSEAGYQVAGRIAEIASGESWGSLFNEHLTSPLAMTRTTYGRSENPQIASGINTTLGDFGSFLRSLLPLPAEGEEDSLDSTSENNEASQKATSRTNVDLMFSPQHRRGKLAYSPFPADWRPALGPWIADNGEGAWTQGALGTVAWVSEDRTVAGVLMFLATPQDARALWREMLPSGGLGTLPAGQP